jgi:hypothetical protein
MLISERYRFIYIGIPKTGTRSAREALCALEGRNLEDNKLYLPPGHKESINHATARQTRELNREIWDLCFKFAVVRNPWERVLSWYAGLAPEKKGGTFDSWLFDYFRNRAGGPVSAKRRYDMDAFPKKVSREELVDYWRDFLLPCAEWVTDESGNVIVDYIARFETLTQDWEVICGKIGIAAPLPHANKSRHLHYSAYYTDEMADFITHRYGKDIEMFGYRFERLLAPSMASS